MKAPFIFVPTHFLEHFAAFLCAGRTLAVAAAVAAAPAPAPCPAISPYTAFGNSRGSTAVGRTGVAPTALAPGPSAFAPTVPHSSPAPGRWDSSNMTVPAALVRAAAAVALAVAPVVALVAVLAAASAAALAAPAAAVAVAAGASATTTSAPAGEPTQSTCAPLAQAACTRPPRRTTESTASPRQFQEHQQASLAE